MEDKKKPSKKSKPADQTEFVGRLLSVSAGSDGTPWRFDMVNKKGEFRSFALETGESARFAAMMILVTSAYMADRKLHVRGTINGNGDRIAGEVWVGTRDKGLKLISVKPEKRALAETPAGTAS
jgi:hypothetical protein